RVAFPAPLANLAEECQCLLVEPDGRAGVAQTELNIALIHQRVAFPPPVADLAGDDEALLVKLDGLARVAQGKVGDAEVAQRSAFCFAIFHDAGGAELALQPGNALARMEAQVAGIDHGIHESNHLPRVGLQGYWRVGRAVLCPPLRRGLGRIRPARSDAPYLPIQPRVCGLNLLA